jgi:hypothetical protein
MDINPDFRTQLEEVRREDARRTFRPLAAGPYRLSIQASGVHHSYPRSLVPVEDYDRWEVTVYAADGSWVTPRTHPELFQDEIWSRYWVEDAPGDATIGQYVPTEIVQTFYDFLLLGPEAYRQMIRPRD